MKLRRFKNFPVWKFLAGGRVITHGATCIVIDTVKVKSSQANPSILINRFPGCDVT
jgi:type 1 glutamine amidotransferase